MIQPVNGCRRRAATSRLPLRASCCLIRLSSAWSVYWATLSCLASCIYLFKGVGCCSTSWQCSLSLPPRHWHCSSSPCSLPWQSSSVSYPWSARWELLYPVSPFRYSTCIRWCATPLICFRCAITPKLHKPCSTMAADLSTYGLRQWYSVSSRYWRWRCFRTSDENPEPCVWKSVFAFHYLSPPQKISVSFILNLHRPKVNKTICRIAEKFINIFIILYMI